MSRLFSLALTLPAIVVMLGSGAAVALPAQAASPWSVPAALLAGVGSGAFAENASGAQVAVTGPGPQVSYSTNGQTWSAPVAVSSGGSGAAIALAANGRAILVWDGGTATAPLLQASVMPPGGTWSAPVTVGALTAGARAPLVGMDGSGNAIVAWAGSTGSKEKGPVYTASLPAGGSWTAVRAVESASVAGSVIQLAVSSAGSAIISWSEQDSVVADSGTILGGFGAPVTVGLALQYEDIPKVTSLSMNNAGQAVMAYNIQGNTGMAATRSASGTWSSPSPLACSFAGDAAIDGAGDAMVVCEASNAAGTALIYEATRLTAGGAWATPVVLTSDEILSSAAVADAAGTFVIALQDATAGALTVFTSPPGGSFGTPSAFSGYSIDSLNTAATGRATLVLASSSAGFESAEPVS
jgi:hypothetical protein